MALVCGNTFIVKPSEQDPGACMMLVKMAQEAGVPDGVLNVIHGQKSCKASLLLVMFDVQSLLCVCVYGSGLVGSRTRIAMCDLHTYYTLYCVCVM